MRRHRGLRGGSVVADDLVMAAAGVVLRHPMLPAAPPPSPSSAAAHDQLDGVARCADGAGRVEWEHRRMSLWAPMRWRRTFWRRDIRRCRARTPGRGCWIRRAPGRVGRGRTVSPWPTSRTTGGQSTGGTRLRNSAACGGRNTAPDGGAGGGAVANRCRTTARSRLCTVSPASRPTLVKYLFISSSLPFVHVHLPYPRHAAPVPAGRRCGALLLCR
ncbi:unnamed protein product [Urochloa humidicola]